MAAKKAVVVTGAAPGSIGHAVAEILAGDGHSVVVTTRIEPLPGFAWHPLELADRDSVSTFAEWLEHTHGPVDTLINSAGVHLDLRSRWTVPAIVDGHEIHWRVNYLGTADVTNRLLPLLLRRGSETGDVRVVNLTSKLHSRGSNDMFFRSHECGPDEYNSWRAYGTSKLALIHHAASLTERYSSAGLRAYAVHPGSVYTNIADRGLEEQRLLSRIRAIAKPLERRMLMSPAQGARTPVMCATATNLEPGYYRGGASADPAGAANDRQARDDLWNRTTQWINAADA